MPSGTFPSEIITAAQASNVKWDIPASVCLVQWALESAWGHAMPPGSNNPFGIKAVGAEPSVACVTHEVVDGKTIEITAHFRAFASLTQAFDAHGELLATAKPYAKARSVRHDPDAFAEALTGVYATDPDYGEKLIGLMQAHDLHAYDAAAPAASPAPTAATSCPTTASRTAARARTWAAVLVAAVPCRFDRKGPVTMPAILLSLLPLLAKFAPDLIGLAFGGNAEAVAGKVEAAVRDIFGTTEPDQVSAAVAADPAKADALKARLDAETANVKAELADTADARAETLALAKSGSPLAWGAAIMSAIIVLGFVGMSIFMVWHPIAETSLVTGSVQTMQYAFVAVVGYWLGSSIGSTVKTEHLAAIASGAAAPPARRRA